LLLPSDQGLDLRPRGWQNSTCWCQYASPWSRKLQGLFAGCWCGSRPAPYAAVCAVIHSRTAPHFQAVTRADNLQGAGNLPAFTMRHNVGAENGNGATALSGLFGLRTSCDSRSHALSGSESNTDCVGVVVAAAGASVAVGLVGALLTVVVGLVLTLKPFAMLRDLVINKSAMCPGFAMSFTVGRPAVTCGRPAVSNQVFFCARRCS
jgi:hypothetical protein